MNTIMDLSEEDCYKLVVKDNKCGWPQREIIKKKIFFYINGKICSGKTTFGCILSNLIPNNVLLDYDRLEKFIINKLKSTDIKSNIINLIHKFLNNNKNIIFVSIFPTFFNLREICLKYKYEYINIDLSNNIDDVAIPLNSQ